MAQGGLNWVVDEGNEILVVYARSELSKTVSKPDHHTFQYLDE